MTIDELKQALREVKKICIDYGRCEDCPIATEKGECPVVEPDLTVVYPVNWPLDWQEDGEA